MNAQQKIKTREQVSETEIWNLDDLFRDFSQWDEHFSGLPSESEIEKELTLKFKLQLSTSPQTLFNCLQYRDEINRKLTNLYVYAGLKNAENVADKKSNEALGKIDNKISSLMSHFAFIEPEVLTIENINSWLEKEPLLTYRYKLLELLRCKPHILSEKEETLLTRISSPLKTFDDIHSKWNNVDLKFNSVKDASGQEHIVTNSRYSLNMQSQDRTLRENTFHSYYGEVVKWRNTITANYYGNMLSGSVLSKIRSFPGFLAAELFHDNIPVSLYDNLIESVRKNVPLLHRSMKLRKKVLKINSVFPYDRSVSLFESKKDSHFTWEDGRDLVLKAIAPLGSEYVEIARQGLTTQRWIDRAENEGKRSGAFSWGSYDSRPYMLQTWTGTLNDVYTLAHELGHSMHSYYSNKNQPFHNAGYTIFVAEVASTLNEALLTHYILNNSPDKDFKTSVLSKSIENFEGTVLRQVLFAAFEKEAAKISDAEEAFTPDHLEDIYFNLNKEWYGSDSSYPDAVRNEWMRIPHFYSSFYVYKYATSYCASLALAENLFKAEKNRDLIFKMFKAGGSKSSLEILKDAGIDMLTPAPIENAFASYQRNIEEAENVFA